jgi:hypothetical protein
MIVELLRAPDSELYAFGYLEDRDDIGYDAALSGRWQKVADIQSRSPHHCRGRYSLRIVGDIFKHEAVDLRMTCCMHLFSG